VLTSVCNGLACVGEAVFITLKRVDFLCRQDLHPIRLEGFNRLVNILHPADDHGILPRLLYKGIHIFDIDAPEVSASESALILMFSWPSAPRTSASRPDWFSRNMDSCLTLICASSDQVSFFGVPLKTPSKNFISSGFVTRLTSGTTRKGRSMDTAPATGTPGTPSFL